MAGNTATWDTGNARLDVIHGALSVSDVYHTASAHALPGHSTRVKFGRNASIAASTPEEVNSFGDLVRLSTASTLSIVSSSAQDAVAGTGASVIHINYLDANYIEQNVEYTLTGLTPVVTTETAIRVLSCWCTVCGTTQSNLGNIVITAVTGGSTQAYIETLKGQTHQSAYTIPAGKTGYIVSSTFSVAETAGGALKEADAFIQGWLRLYNESSNDNYEAWRETFQVNINNRGAGYAHVPQELQSPILAKTDIKIVADVGVNGTEVDARLFILLVDNE